MALLARDFIGLHGLPREYVHGRIQPERLVNDGTRIGEIGDIREAGAPSCEDWSISSCRRTSTSGCLRQGRRPIRG